LKTSKRKFGKGNKISTEIRNKLHSIQFTMITNLHPSLVAKAKELSFLLEQENIYELNMLKQRYENNWEALGDENSTTFHKSLVIINTTKSIHCIKYQNCVICKNPRSIKSAILQYFTSTLADQDLPLSDLTANPLPAFKSITSL